MYFILSDTARSARQLVFCRLWLVHFFKIYPNFKRPYIVQEKLCNKSSGNRIFIIIRLSHLLLVELDEK